MDPRFLCRGFILNEGCVVYFNIEVDIPKMYSAKLKKIDSSDGGGGGGGGGVS